MGGITPWALRTCMCRERNIRWPLAIFVCNSPKWLIKVSSRTHSNIRVQMAIQIHTDMANLMANQFRYSILYTRVE